MHIGHAGTLMITFSSTTALCEEESRERVGIWSSEWVDRASGLYKNKKMDNGQPVYLIQVRTQTHTHLRAAHPRTGETSPI